MSVSSAYAICFPLLFFLYRLSFCLEYLSIFLSPDDFTNYSRLNVGIIFLWEAFQDPQVELSVSYFYYTNPQWKPPWVTYWIYYLRKFLPSYSDSRRQGLCSFPLTPQCPCIVLRKDTEIVQMTTKALSNPCHLSSSGLCRCCSSVWNGFSYSAPPLASAQTLTHTFLLLVILNSSFYFHFKYQFIRESFPGPKIRLDWRSHLYSLDIPFYCFFFMIDCNYTFFWLFD